MRSTPCCPRTANAARSVRDSSASASLLRNELFGINARHATNVLGVWNPLGGERIVATSPAMRGSAQMGIVDPQGIEHSPCFDKRFGILAGWIGVRHDPAADGDVDLA